jgi:hypothetical protein
LLRQTWELHASLINKEILCFESITAFEEILPMLDRNVPIYIDSDLEDSIQGEEYTKYLSEQGFLEIYLATGHSSSYFVSMPWVRKIIGKKPPF